MAEQTENSRFTDMYLFLQSFSLIWLIVFYDNYLFGLWAKQPHTSENDRVFNKEPPSDKSK